MSPGRTLYVARGELAAQLRRPMVWILLALLVLLTWGLATGGAQISSGDATVGGKKAFINSEFANAIVFCVLVTLFYAFFVAVSTGMTVIRDEELKVGELLHATRLTAHEYVWGKFLGATTLFMGVLLIHVIVTLLFQRFLPIENAAEVRGAFGLHQYVRPALLFAVPTIVGVAGVSFWIGERTRRPILVFFVPVVLLLACGFFLWNWSPAWLDQRINRALMFADLTGFRWLNETHLKVDRGVDFYNTQPIATDILFLVNRWCTVLLGLGAVVLSAGRFERRLRGSATVSRGEMSRVSATPALAGPAAVLPPEFLAAPLRTFAMRSALPRFWTTLGAILRAEVHELRSQPGLYLFVPLILLQTLGTSLVAVGAFDTPLLVTTGTFVVRSMNTLSLLVTLLLLFYTVESLERERATGVAPILNATPVRTAAILAAKALANSVVAVVILLAALVALVIVLLIQGRVGLEFKPLLMIWGLLLLPTFFLWSSFVAAVHSITANRWTTYGVGSGVVMLWGWLQFKGWMNWAANWNLWSAIGWSDMGALQLDRKALVLNRIMALGLAVFFLAVAARWFPRRDQDLARALDRLQPKALWRATLRWSPLFAVPLVCGVWLATAVHNGPGGSTMKKQMKDYWKRNFMTWRDVPVPDVSAVVADIDLDPARSALTVKGNYTLVNRGDKPLREFPVTIGLHLKDATWTLNGTAVKPDDRAHLLVFTPPVPLAPGATLQLGFAYHGAYPDGISKNGGGAAEFILPSGVVLTSFAPTYVPYVGYVDDVGVEDDNRTEPREYPPDYYKEALRPAFGSIAPFTVDVTLHAPAEYTLNSVGTLVSDTVQNGRRTAVWKTDEPVRFWNVVAGRWAVKRGQGTAVFYHPAHTYNVDEMVAALDGARHWYGEWFAPFPWKELKLSEFPALAGYAQGFPTNITFSETIGFLTKSDVKANLAFMVAAHESAHQWWGNMLTPGNGPGGNILSEGMAHFSTALLIQQIEGEGQRIAFMKQIEAGYGRDRQVDSEQPMVKIQGNRPGDTTVTYDRGGWVFWMLKDFLGREEMFGALREFMAKYRNGPDYPLIEDLVETLRPHAKDPAAFDAFVKQWVFSTDVPEYKLDGATRDKQNDGTWLVKVKVKNAGKTTMPLEVAAATKDERFDDAGKPKAEYRDCRASVTLGPGEEQPVEIRCDFEPAQVLVDPDFKVLQINRKLAVSRF